MSDDLPAFHPSRLLVTITRVTDGPVLLVESPHLPGWRAAAQDGTGLLRVLDEAWRECRVRQYAEQRQQPYHAPDVNPDEPRANGSWQHLGGARWMSPGGRVYAEHTAAVQRHLRRTAS